MTRTLPTRRGAIPGLVLGVLLLLGLTACGGGAGSSTGANQGVPPAPEGDQVSVKVTNNALDEATLFAMFLGRQQRLGTVQPGRTQVFYVDIQGAEEVAVRIRLLGGGTCTTPPRSVSVGEQIVTEIPPDLSMIPGCR